jgi:choline dehydrogenase-like flavoprotein
MVDPRTGNVIVVTARFTIIALLRAELVIAAARDERHRDDFDGYRHWGRACSIDSRHVCLHHLRSAREELFVRATGSGSNRIYYLRDQAGFASLPR